RGDVETTDGCRAPIRAHQSGQHAQGCRFAGAVWAEQGGDASVVRGERDIGHRLHNRLGTAALADETFCELAYLDHSAAPVGGRKKGGAGSRSRHAASMPWNDAWRTKR